MINFFNLHSKCDDDLISKTQEKSAGLLGEGKLPEEGAEMFSPSKEIINNILNFSRSYDAVETRSTGYVEMNLN
jgi:hypothetical protein